MQDWEQVVCGYCGSELVPKQKDCYTDGAGAAAVVAGLFVDLEEAFKAACCSFR
jgi:hypothetical protein